jgi:FkbM family methyltransferase
MSASEPIAPHTLHRPSLRDYAEPAPRPPEPAPPAGAPPELLRKLELEAAMLAAPQDRGLRSAYFEQLGRIAISNTGLQTALLPELGAPLYFRCGTPDIALLANIFRDRALAFEMRPTPLRILVIGAYAGYAAVDLARRYPRAELLAVEPLADNYRLLALNTGAWRQIRIRNVAVWHHATRLAPTRLQADWTVRLHDEAELADRGVPACSVSELLAQVGWNGADLVVCNACGAEREVFADPLAPWLVSLDAALVRLHESLAPRATEWVNAAFEPAVFEHRKIGEMELYVRRVPRQALPPAPPELPLLRGAPGLTPLGLADVAATSFGFFVYDGDNCQLHPNHPGGKPARAIFTLRADGQRRFVSGVLHAGYPSAPIAFTGAVQREDGTLAGHGEVVLKPRESGRLVLDLGGPLSGIVRVLLQTAMAPGAANANMAWSRWLGPKLV